MIYSNISGTSKPSFKIGPKGVSISSGAVINNIRAVKNFQRTPNEIRTNQNRFAPNADVNRRLLANNEGLLYDCEIPIGIVKDIIDNKDNTYTFILYDRNTGEERNFVIQAGVGNSSVAFSGEVAVENNLAAFTDTTGNRIHDSGYSVYAGTLDSEGVKNKDDEVPTVSAVHNYVGGLTNYLNKRVSGKLELPEGLTLDEILQYYLDHNQVNNSSNNN